jgi:low temperature requirement protein LtrA
MISRDEDLGVTTLELFFDLVFVFTLTQLTALLAARPTLRTAGQVLLIFVVLYWMYGGYAWLTNQVPPTRARIRILLILSMGGFLICALAVPEAFDGSGIAFGLGYLLVILVHGSLYAEGYGASALRFVPFNIVGALFITLAGILDGGQKYALWGAAILLQLVSSYTVRNAPEETRLGFDIRSSHFVERHGLLLIVAFGESVIAVGIGIGDEPLDLGVFGTVLLGLAMAASMWWSYFVDDEDRALEALASAPMDRRVQLALAGYFYAYVPMLLGVIAMAAGVKNSIGKAGEALDSETALLLAVGVALYLAGEMLFRQVLGIRPWAHRAVAAAVALGTAALGVFVAVAVQLVALVATLVAMLVAENKFPGPSESALENVVPDQ